MVWSGLVCFMVKRLLELVKSWYHGRMATPAFLTRFHPGRSLWGRLFFTFSIFLVMIAIPMLVLFMLVRPAYRDLSTMQAQQADISSLVDNTNASYDLFTKYLMTCNELDFSLFHANFQNVRNALHYLDGNLPPNFHYNIYDLESMADSFDEMAASIREDVQANIAFIYIDRRKAELGRLRDYLNNEYARLLTGYLQHVRDRSLAIRGMIDTSELVIGLILVAILVLGWVIATLVSGTIARPVQSLVAS